jgi:hypothetical protein
MTIDAQRRPSILHHHNPRAVVFDGAAICVSPMPTAVVCGESYWRILRRSLNHSTDLHRILFGYRLDRMAASALRT